MKELRATYVYHSIKPVLTAVLLGGTVVWVVLSAVYKQWAWLIVGASFCFLAAVLFMVSLAHILYVIYCRADYSKYCKDVQDDPDNIVLFEGLQRTGKSDTAKRMAIIRAEYNWQKIVQDFAVMSRTVDRHLYDAVWQSHYREIRETYLFYKNRPHLFPLIVSNVPMSVDGLDTLKFKFGMLLQQERLPYRSVILLDELKNSGLSNRDSGKIPRELDESLRFFGQFYEGKIYGTEQNKTMAILEYRNMTVNYTMQAMADVLKPRMLQWLYDRRMRKYIDRYGMGVWHFKLLKGDPFACIGIVHRCVIFNRRGRKILNKILSGEMSPLHIQRKALLLYSPSNARKAARELEKLSSVIESIGFVKYTRVFRGSTQGNTVNDANQSAATSDIVGRRKIWKYYMPCMRRYDSDTRLFRDINRAKDMQISTPAWRWQRTIDRAYWDEIEKERNIAIQKAGGYVGNKKQRDDN